MDTPNRKKYYEILILITYVVMAGVGIYLNFISKNRVLSVANIIVNVMMFLIVAAIMGLCVYGSLLPTASLTRDLIRVTAKIEEDAKHTHSYLWEKYSADREEFFEDRTLRRQYQDYCYELERIVKTDKTYYKCDIEDYIGYDLVDAVIHRDRLNQVAGVMTGLGILGTFIGLSLGLQSFNTGSTAEITNSIAPLMGGIKVAFHTSIYGLVFSIVFNFVYKRRLDDAEKAVRDFLSAYKKFVLPDTTTDGVNRLMELQQLQTEAILSVSDAVGNRLSEELTGFLQPQFDRLDKTITDFANVATRNQTEQLSRIVDVFILEMNRSLGNIFTNLSDIMNKTLEVQRSNDMQMQQLFENNLSTAENVHLISEETGAVADALRLYSEKVTALEKRTAETLELLRLQTENNRAILNGAGQYMSDLEKYRKSLEVSGAAYDKRLAVMEERLKSLQKLTESVPDEVNETFNIINENLQIVEKHFLDTIEHTNETISKMPELIDYSYDSMEKSLSSMTRSVEKLRLALEKNTRMSGPAARP